MNTMNEKDEWDEAFGKTVSATQAPLLAGRYRVVRQLGQGGMGSVWLVKDERLDDCLFAVKMLPSVLMDNKRAYRQIKEEALVSLRLTHPNIVALRSFETQGGSPFLVMDYVEGQTLDDYLAEKDTLTEEETVKLLLPIAQALDYAHTKGVIHRDVKPANIMIAKDGTPFILDFGISREIQETMTRVTGKNSSGTLMYMSPEQLKGKAPTPAQDIYSFAAMVYECLAGHPPFYRGDIEYQILNEPPPPFEGKFAVTGSVMAGLAKDADPRPKSCSAVLAQNVTKPAPVPPPPPPPPPPVEQHTAGEVKMVTLPGGAKLELVWCPPGSFMMGSPETENGRTDDEVPHRVTLTKGFWMGKYPVTQHQWFSVMGNCPSYFSKVIDRPSWIGRVFRGEQETRAPDKNRPVEQVSWENCQAFCRKAGLGLRLPTEAEWEYACRAGTTGAYAGSLDDMAWYNDNSDNRAHDVGQKRPNAWGLYDMHGNVWEWCSDWYGPYGGDKTDPSGPSSGTFRVNRGGCWNSNARYCRSAYRFGFSPGICYYDLGFRLCCSAEPLK